MLVIFRKRKEIVTDLLKKYLFKKYEQKEIHFVKKGELLTLYKKKMVNRRG